MHLGHILSYNKQDIVRVVKDMNRKANSVLCKFSALDPFVKCYLIKTYCLWSLSSPSIRIAEIALNKILRNTYIVDGALAQPKISKTSIKNHFF